MENKFNIVVDIKGEERVFPKDINGYSLFFTTKDPRFFIYALYTKEDFSQAQLIELDYDSYKKVHSLGAIENVVTDMDMLGQFLLALKQEVIFENVTVGELLDMDED